MKKLVMLMFCAFALILVLKTSLVVANPNLCFDFDGDAECDTSWDIGGTETVEIYLVDWDTSSWSSEDLFGVQMVFYYDDTMIGLNIGNSFANDTLNGGPFDPGLSLPLSVGDGKYILTASMGPLECTDITDKMLLWTLELAGLTSGTSDITIQVDFNGDPPGAIVPGGVDCSGVHEEDGGDGQATITVLFDDGDGDGVPDVDDNCPDHPNGEGLSTCVKEIGGVLASYRVDGNFITCTSDDDCVVTEGTCGVEQEDWNGNGCGDVCECYSDVTGSGGVPDGRVTAQDYAVLQQEFGRDCVLNPPCLADFNEDDTVTTPDYAILKKEFSRGDCPTCPE